MCVSGKIGVITFSTILLSLQQGVSNATYDWLLLNTYEVKCDNSKIVCGCVMWPVSTCN